MIAIFSIILIVLGLCLFETVNSIDNAIINAQVLSTMRKKYRRWFLIWGIIFAVFVVRGLLPWIIVWVTNPSLGPIKAFTAAFSNNPEVIQAIELSSPILLMGGGVFLLFLFIHWFIIERKFIFKGKEILFKRKIWFFIIAFLFLVLIIFFTIRINPVITISAIIGSLVFSISQGFKHNAERTQKSLTRKRFSDVSKILYLEVLDASFSIDGVLGAFAFTLSVPLIILGNGLGAFVVRQFTVGNIDRIKKYIYLKNGAMYSILFLGIIMIMNGFGFDAPEWLSPVVTFLIVGYFYYKSKRHIKVQELKRAFGKK